MCGSSVWVGGWVVGGDIAPARGDFVEPATSVTHRMTDCWQLLRANSENVIRNVAMGSPAVCVLSVTCSVREDVWQLRRQNVVVVSWPPVGSPGKNLKTSVSTVSIKTSSGSASVTAQNGVVPSASTLKKMEGSTEGGGGCHAETRQARRKTTTPRAPELM